MTLNSRQEPALSFPEYVDGVTTGRGIWKWNNALEAYERHLASFKQTTVRVGEVGVWSGGSILMWQTVLGPLCHVFGLDIAEESMKFADGRTTITIGDQGDPAMWQHFFSTVTPSLEVLVDDGGHTAPLMMTTTTSVWPHLAPGGVLAIEDIHGAHYLEPFFKPVAEFYGAHASEVAGVHIYPYLLLVHKSGGATAVDPTRRPGASVAPGSHISSMAEIAAAVDNAPPGSLVVLENAGWGNFLNPQGLAYFFEYFNELHAPTAMYDTPEGCSHTADPVCSTKSTNSPMQTKIKGVHILVNKCVIEIPTSEPVIEAVRHGSKWVKYPTDHY